MDHRKHLAICFVTGGLWFPFYLFAVGLSVAKVGVAKAVVSVQDEINKQSK